MKKVFILLIIAILIGLLSYFGYKSINKHAENKKIETSIETLPEFSFYSFEDIVFTHDSLRENTSVVLFYFHPSCEHCQYEAQQLVNHKESFKDIQVLMISTASVNEVKTFFDMYQLNKLPTLTMLLDKNNQFEHYFGSAIFPTVLIYSKDWKLKKKNKGEIKIEAIIECLK